MKLLGIAPLLALSCAIDVAAATHAVRRPATNAEGDGERALRGVVQWQVTVKNVAYMQPMSPFFVMVHNHKATPLFTLAEPATEALGELAENGNPGQLIELYETTEAEGVFYASSAGSLLMPGATESFMIETTGDYPLLSMASMAVNTNDCFVALLGVHVLKYQEKWISSPGYDSGTEENDELCSRIPGPACADSPKQPILTQGEGFVHINRGIQGVGDLSKPTFDWRNPMLYVWIQKMD